MEAEQKIQKLLEEGLYHYGLGEIQIATELWKQVLEIDPENEVAREYLAIELGPDWEKTIKPKSKPERPSSPPSLSSEEKQAKPVQDEFKLAQQHLQAGKAEQALSLLFRLVESDPDNSLYLSYLELSKALWLKNFLQKVKSLMRIPELNIKLSQITELNLTEGQGFILSLINGEMSLDDILSLAPLPPFEVFYTLDRFMSSGLIKLKAES